MSEDEKVRSIVADLRALGVPEDALWPVLNWADSRGCGCYACIGDRPTGLSFLTVGMTRMIVCGLCGNKRCPHGTDHRNDCIGSNDPEQPGSRYGGLS